MADFREQVIERDLSGFVTNPQNENGAFVIQARKGRNKPRLIDNEQDYLLYFGTPDVDNWGGFEAIQYVRQAPAWIASPYHSDATWAGVDVRDTSVVAFGTRTGRNYDAWSVSSYTSVKVNQPQYLAGTGNGLTATFTGTIPGISVPDPIVSSASEPVQVVKANVVVTSDSAVAGTFTANTNVTSGTVNLTTGAYSITFAGVAGTIASYTTTVDLLNAPTAGYEEVAFSVSKVGADSTGLANDATVYTATVTVDGTPYPVTVTGSAAQTFTTLASQITADLTGATTSITGGKLRITSATTGVTSTIVITDGTLFSSLTDFLVISAPVDGTGAGMNLTVQPKPLAANITIDGVTIENVNFGNTDNSFTNTDMVGVINTAFGSTVSSVSTDYVTIVGTIRDAVAGKVIIAPPTDNVTYKSAVNILFDSSLTADTTITNFGTYPTLGIPRYNQTFYIDYNKSANVSATTSHSFFTYSPYNDSDYTLAAKITTLDLGTLKYRLELFDKKGTEYFPLATYDYSLNKIKNGFGASLYIFDVFRDDPYVVPFVNTSYAGSANIAFPQIVDLTGGNRGTTPTTSDFNSVWDNFQYIAKYPVKTFMDVYGTYANKVLSLINNYQPYAFGITVVPFGNNASGAMSYRSLLGIDDAKIALYTNWSRIEDPYNNSSVWVSNVGKIGVKYALMANTFDSLSPAGIDENQHGGQISNVGFKILEVENDYTDNQLKLMDEAQINPIVFNPVYGVMIVGDRTLQVTNSDTSFVGTRRLYNYIIDNVQKQVLKKQEFKLNDPQHRLLATLLTNEFLNPIVSNSYLREAVVVCNESNNTDIILNQRKFVLDIYVKVTPNSQVNLLRLTRLSQTQTIAQFVS